MKIKAIMDKHKKEIDQHLDTKGILEEEVVKKREWSNLKKID